MTAQKMRVRRAWPGSALLLTVTWALMTVAPVANATQARGGLITGPGGRLIPADPPPLETDLVLLTVSVTSKGIGVPGIAQDRFQILEDGVEQKIAYYWVDTRPVSVGLVIDGSSAVDDLMNEAIRGAGPAFLKTKRPEDEYFVIVFSDSPSMVVTYTTDAKVMPRVFPQTGEEPLYDAIYNGLDAMKEAANPRKVLLVITAGGDNGKGQNQDQLVNYTIKQPVQVYSIDMGGASEPANVLELLAGLTGGRATLSGASSYAVEAMCAEMAQALKTQYLIGYRSTNTAKDGKRRGVKVKISSPAGSPKLTVWTKSGYYAAKEPKDKTTVVSVK